MGGGRLGDGSRRHTYLLPVATLLLDSPLLCQQLRLDLREVFDVGQQTELFLDSGASVSLLSRSTRAITPITQPKSFSRTHLKVWPHYLLPAATLLLDPPLLCQQLCLDLREVFDVGQQMELVPGQRGLCLLVVQVHQFQYHHTGHPSKVVL